MTSSLFTFALYKNVNMSKRKTLFFFDLKSLSDSQQSFFTSQALNVVKDYSRFVNGYLLGAKTDSRTLIQHVAKYRKIKSQVPSRSGQAEADFKCDGLLEICCRQLYTGKKQLSCIVPCVYAKVEITSLYCRNQLTILNLAFFYCRVLN